MSAKREKTRKTVRVSVTEKSRRSETRSDDDGMGFSEADGMTDGEMIFDHDIVTFLYFYYSSQVTNVEGETRYKSNAKCEN